MLYDELIYNELLSACSELDSVFFGTEAEMLWCSDLAPLPLCAYHLNTPGYFNEEEYQKLGMMVVSSSTGNSLYAGNSLWLLYNRDAELLTYLKYDPRLPDVDPYNLNTTTVDFSSIMREIVSSSEHEIVYSPYTNQDEDLQDEDLIEVEEDRDVVILDVDTGIETRPLSEEDFFPLTWNGSEFVIERTPAEGFFEEGSPQYSLAINWSLDSSDEAGCVGSECVDSVYLVRNDSYNMLQSSNKDPSSNVESPLISAHWDANIGEMMVGDTTAQHWIRDQNSDYGMIMTWDTEEVNMNTANIYLVRSDLYHALQPPMHNKKAIESPIIDKESDIIASPSSKEDKEEESGPTKSWGDKILDTISDVAEAAGHGWYNAKGKFVFFQNTWLKLDSLIDLSNNQSSAYHTHLPPNNCPEGQHLCLERDDTREIIGTYCKIGSCKDES